MAETPVGIPTRVLVLGMAHEDGTIVAEEVLPVAEACRQTPEQVRSCLRRLVREGLFTREGRGRTAQYRATEETRIWQKQSGAWKHVHFHRSVPAK